jgi:hypothetical protein
MEADATVA